VEASLQPTILPKRKPTRLQRFTRSQRLFWFTRAGVNAIKGQTHKLRADTQALVLEGGNLQAIEKSDFLKKSDFFNTIKSTKIG
jgi:hypothetical protein